MFRHFRSQCSPCPDEEWPFVTILKPLKGIDSGIIENLESFFKLDYPSYELIFSVASSEDPVLKVVKNLIEKYPKVRTKLICEPTQLGPNPKINNLVHAYQEAASDLVLISDSNIRATPGYLKGLIPDITPSVGVITAVVAGTCPQGLGGWLEASYLNTFFNRWMFLSKMFGFPSVIGKSMLFRKSMLKRAGGLEVLGRYIAEDYMAGHVVLKLDLSVELMRNPIPQFIGKYSFEDFWQRHLRWGRIRKSIAPLAFLIEPIFFSTLSGVLGGWALSGLFSFPFIWGWTLHMIIWALMDLSLYSLMDRLNWRAIFAWGIREILAFPLWFCILCGNTVLWRGSRYRLLAGGLLQGAK